MRTISKPWFLLLLFHLSALISCFGQTTLKKDTINIFFAERQVNGKPVLFLPEIEAILDTLNRDSNDTKTYVDAQYLRRLKEARNLGNTVEIEFEEYQADSGSYDPSKDITFLRYITPFLKDYEVFVEIKFQEIASQKYYYEFLRYRVEKGAFTAQKEQASDTVASAVKETTNILGKLVYERSSSTIIDLVNMDKRTINNELRKAIIKIFPNYNEDPRAKIQVNKLPIDTTYYFGIGDTIKLSAEVLDPDSPIEDITYNWNLTAGNAIPLIPLEQGNKEQTFVINQPGDFQITLVASDGIRLSKPAIIKLSIINPPQIEDLYFAPNLYVVKNNKRKVLVIHFWDFNGIPFYYNADHKEAAFILTDKDKIENLQVMNDNQSEARSIETKQKIGNTKVSPSEDFKISYELSDSNQVKGKLIVPYNLVDPKYHNFKFYLLKRNIKSIEPQILKARFIRFTKFSLLYENQLGILLKGQGRYFKTNFGAQYRSGKNFRFHMAPGVVISSKSRWEFTLKGGISWLPLISSKSKRSNIGMDLSVNYYKSLFDLGETQSVQFGLFYEPKIKYPLLQFKYSPFIEMLVSDPDAPLVFGIKLGLTARDYRTQKGGNQN